MYKKILMPVFILMLLLGLGNMNASAMEIENDSSNIQNGAASLLDNASVWRDQIYKASQSTYIQQSPADSNHSDKEEIYLKGFTDTFKRDGLLMFDLNPYSQSNQNGLTLRLPIKDLDKKGVSYLPEYYFSLYVTTANWNESVATWENTRDFEGYRNLLLYDKIVLTPESIGSYVDIDVTDALYYADDDGKLAFALIVDENPAGSNNGQNAGIKIHSKEGASNPIGVPQLIRGEVYPVNIDSHEFTVELNEQPQLPATVNVEFSDNTFADIPVAWDIIDEYSLSQENTFDIQGTLQGYPEVALANISVINTVPAIEVTGVETLELTIEKGKYPELPNTVKVEFSDGTSQDVPTEWEEISEPSLTTKGTFHVTGSLEAMLETTTAKINVIELEDKSNSLNNEVFQLPNMKENTSNAVINEFIEVPFHDVIDTGTALLFNDEVVNISETHKKAPKTGSLRSYNNEEINSRNSSKNILIVGISVFAVFIAMLLLLVKKRKEKEAE